MIETPQDILEILAANPNFSDWEQYGAVNTKREGDYILFNYKAEAQYENRWNAFERMSRGLIVDTRDLRVLARPFDKFFNWGAHGRKTNSPIDYVMAKMDGSLGICWFDPNRYDWRITTRGSFNSEQGEWATQFLHQHAGDKLLLLDKKLTYLFEIVYPENRIVVDYGETEGLFLLAARSKKTGQYIHFVALIRNVANALGLYHAPSDQTPQTASGIINMLKSTKGTEEEGLITVHRDGSRWKFKAPDYVRLHKLISNFSFAKTLEAIATHSFDVYIEGVPDEFLDQVRIWHNLITNEHRKVHERALLAFDLVAHLPTRKEQASFLINHHRDVASYVFAMLDDKYDISTIYKKHDFSHLEEAGE